MLNGELVAWVAIMVIVALGAVAWLIWLGLNAKDGPGPEQ